MEGQVFILKLDVFTEQKLESEACTHFPPLHCLGLGGIMGFEQLKMYGLNNLIVSKDVFRWLIHKEHILIASMFLGVSERPGIWFNVSRGCQSSQWGVWRRIPELSQCLSCKRWTMAADISLCICKAVGIQRHNCFTLLNSIQAKETVTFNSNFTCSSN